MKTPMATRRTGGTPTTAVMVAAVMVESERFSEEQKTVAEHSS